MLDGELRTKKLYTGTIGNRYVGENYEIYSNQNLIKKVCTKVLKSGKYISSTYDSSNNELIIINNEGINKFKLTSINDNIKFGNEQYTITDLFEY